MTEPGPGPANGRRTVVLLHAGAWKTWPGAQDELPGIDVRHFDLRRLGRGGELPAGIPRPQNRPGAVRRVAAPLRRLVVGIRGGRHERALRRLVKNSSSPVFLVTDQERLNPSQAERVVDWLPRLQALGTVLNHPTRSLRRWALLKRLHVLGMNSFDVHRASDWGASVRYPAFLRVEDDHRGHMIPVASHDELVRERDRIVGQGGHLDRWIVVERIHVPTVDGWTPKHGAYRLGDDILPASLDFGRDWIVRFGEQPPADLQELARTWQRENPHAPELMRRFQAAEIEFGRIDYAVVDGQIETFEINTNPLVTDTSGTLSPHDDAAYRHVRQRLHRAILDLPEGWTSLDTPTS